MIALSVIAAFVTILAGIFAVITRQMALAHRDRYLEEVAFNESACADRLAQKPVTMKAKPRAATKRQKPAGRRTPAHGHSAFLLH